MINATEAENDQGQAPFADNDWQSESIDKLTFGQLFKGWQGKLIMLGGVIFPAFFLSASAVTCAPRLMLLFFNHPLESFIETLLVANIPLSVYGAWHSQLKGYSGLSVGRSISLGAAIGVSLLLALLALSGMFIAPAAGTEAGAFLATFFLPSAFALTAGILLVERVRRRTDFSSSRQRVVILTGLGVAAAAILGVASEAKPWAIRLAERQAVSSVLSEKQEGLKCLRSINPARELLIECSDERAVGLCGVFMPLGKSSQRDLYFAVTGEPFDFRDIHNNNLASVSDESLARQVVGEPVTGLSLERSSLTGKVNTDTLEASVDWTFVFKNDTSQGQSAKAVIALPARAVATKFTLWSDGKPDDAVFYNASVQSDHIWAFKNRFIGVNASRTSLSLEDIGNGRVLIDCGNIGAQEEVKARLTVLIPMKPDTAETAALTLPRFLGTNFDLSGEHQIRLRSSLPVKSAISKLRTSRTFGGDWNVAGELTASDLTHSPLSFSIDRPSDPLPISTLFTSSDTSEPIRIEQVVNCSLVKIPSHLVVVVDGSVSLNKYRREVCEALKHISARVDTAVIISAANGKDEAITVPKAIEIIDSTNFVGGQDNLKSVIRAAELAGETAAGAVLWVHGPQPAGNREIYIMSQYESKPKFFDVPIESCTTDTSEFFKNYSEIGPFETVPGEGTVGLALENLSKQWKPLAMEYSVETRRVKNAHRTEKLLLGRDGGDIVTLWAHDQCLTDLNEAKPKAAVKIALEHKFLSPLSPATVVIEPKSVTSNQFIEEAKNGLPAKQEHHDGEEAFTTTSIYPPGSCRVNNLANLEALLNAVANTAEIVGIIWGISRIYSGVCSSGKGGATFSVITGIALILLGLGVPGFINWLVGSARDANCFS